LNDDVKQGVGTSAFGVSSPVSSTSASAVPSVDTTTPQGGMTAGASAASVPGVSAQAGVGMVSPQSTVGGVANQIPSSDDSYTATDSGPDMGAVSSAPAPSQTMSSIPVDASGVNMPSMTPSVPNTTTTVSADES